MHVFRRPAGKRAAARFPARAETLAGLAHPAIPRVRVRRGARGHVGGERRDRGHEPAPRSSPRGWHRCGRCDCSERWPTALDAAHAAGLVARRRATGERDRAGAAGGARDARWASTPRPGRPARPVDERTPTRAPEVRTGRGRARGGRVRPGSCDVRVPGGTPPFRWDRELTEPAAAGARLPLVERDRRPRADDRPAERHAGGGEMMGEVGAGLVARELVRRGPRAHPGPHRPPNARAALARAAGVETPRGRHARHDPGGAARPARATRWAGSPLPTSPPPPGAPPRREWSRWRCPRGGGARGREPAGLSLNRPLALQRANPQGRIDAGLAADRGAVLDPARLVGDRGARRAPREGGAPRRPNGPALRRAQGRRPIGALRGVHRDGAAAVACAAARVGGAGPCAEAARGLAVRGAEAYDPAGRHRPGRTSLAGDMRRLRLRRAPGLRRAAAPDAHARRPASPRDADRASARLGARESCRKRSAPPQAVGARRRVLARLVAPTAPTARWRARPAGSTSRRASGARSAASAAPTAGCGSLSERSDGR